MRRVVIVILDGLRRDMLTDGLTPRLSELRRAAAEFANHRSVFPSTTRVASASLATGCHPWRHELVGNTLALHDGTRLHLHDAGHPEFFERKRRLTGRALGVPTLAEYVKEIGGAIVFSNVSPGGAYAQDPDGHGEVYHRAGSYGPGRVAVPDGNQLRIGPELAGDAVMTERFVEEALNHRKPSLAVIWLGHPDTTQHVVPLGSPAHLHALATADWHAGRVIEAAVRLRDDGEDILLIVGSDHGQVTANGTIDVEAELVAAKLKANRESPDLVVAANGTAVLLYLDHRCKDRATDVIGFLKSCPWVDRVIAEDGLWEVGLGPQHGLVAAVTLRNSSEANAYGISGTALTARDSYMPPPGCGQHGGLAEAEQAPFLLISGTGFAAGAVHRRSSLVDIAPTVLAHLGLPATGMDGRPLQSP